MQRLQTFGDAHLGRAFTNAKDRVKAQEWREAGLRDISFGEVDMESFRDSGCMVKIFFLIELVFSLEYVYLFVSDALALYSLYEDRAGVNIMTGRGIYIVTVVLSLLFLLVDWRAAKKIIVTDDISDSFLNDLAYRRQMYRSYSVYCFFYHILDGLPLGQKIAKFTYFLLKNWKRLCFVDMPQGVIALLGAGSETNHMQRVLLNIKFVMVCIRVGMLVIACLAWPIIRFSLARRFDNKAFSLELFVTFTIDYRINQMLGLIVDPEKPGLKPRYKVTAPNHAGRTTFVTNPNSTEGVEGPLPQSGSSTTATPLPGMVPSSSAPIAALPFPTPSSPTYITPTHTHTPGHQHNHNHSHTHSPGGHSGYVQSPNSVNMGQGMHSPMMGQGSNFQPQYNGNNYNNTGYHQQPQQMSSGNYGYNQNYAQQGSYNGQGSYNQPQDNSGFQTSPGFGASTGLQLNVQLPGQSFPLTSPISFGATFGASGPLMSPAGGFMDAPLLPGMNGPTDGQGVQGQFGLVF